MVESLPPKKLMSLGLNNKIEGYYMEENPRSLLIRLVDELLNHIKCRFKPAYKKVWKIVSPENGICTNCGETVYNDKGIKNI